MVGSTEFPLIWKEKVTPAGRSISRLAPSMRRTSDSGSIGSQWATPQARDHFPAHTPEYIAAKKAEGHGMANLNDQVSAWATPKASDGEGGRTTKTEGGGNAHLPIQAREAAGSCPSASIIASAETPTRAILMAKEIAGNFEPATNGTPSKTCEAPIQARESASWPTPTSRDGKDGSYTPNVPLNGLLGRMVWSTPRASDGEKGSPQQSFGAGGTPLPAQAFGTTQNSASAQTEKRGALNPEFVFWLMGFPAEWVSCALAAMASFRKSRPKSSPR